MSTLNERANLLMHELFLANQCLIELALERTGSQVSSISLPVVDETVPKPKCEIDSQIQPACQTEVSLSHMPSNTAPEKQDDALETFIRIIPNILQPLGDNPAVASELSLKLQSTRRIVASLSYEVILRSVLRPSAEHKRQQYSEK